MPSYNGKLVTLDMVLTLLGVKVLVQGTAEILDIRRRVNDD